MTVLVLVDGFEDICRPVPLPQRLQHLSETLLCEFRFNIKGRHRQQLGLGVAHLHDRPAIAVDESQRIGGEHKHTVMRLVECGLEASQRLFALTKRMLSSFALGDILRDSHESGHDPVVTLDRQETGCDTAVGLLTIDRKLECRCFSCTGSGQQSLDPFAIRRCDHVQIEDGDDLLFVPGPHHAKPCGVHGQEAAL